VIIRGFIGSDRGNLIVGSLPPLRYYPHRLPLNSKIPPQVAQKEVKWSQKPAYMAVARHHRRKTV
jgi:hypothetical protein